LGNQRLNKKYAFGILSSDCISSSAYGGEQILLALIPAFGLAAFTIFPPMVGVILLMLLIITFSYRDVINTYTQSGSAYIVARENFGRVVSQVAAIELMFGYIITVAIQSAAGVAEDAVGDDELRRLDVLGLGAARLHSGHHCGILAHEDSIVKADNCEIAQNQHPALAVKGGAQAHLIDCGILKGYRSGVLILEGGSVTMERCRVIGNMGTGLEIRSGGRLHLTHSQVDYGGTIGVSAAAGAVGIISDSQFTGSDPMQAVKLEKGAKVAVEGIRST
jgi:amino acid transporter